jgi:hypothetical protein
MSTSEKRTRRSLQLVLFAAVLCCMAIIIPASAGSGDPTHVMLNITPDVICTEHQINITFHANSGMNAGVNGFLIGFNQEDVDIDDISAQCITVYNQGLSGSPSEIVKFTTPDPEYTQYGFPDDLAVIKLWTPIPITFNTDVTIVIDCGVDIECPCNCSGYQVWVARDGGEAVASQKQYLKTQIDVTSGGNGTVKLQPSGPTTPPNFSATFPCCSNASFYIQANPCYYISSVIVTPLCGDDEEECEFVEPSGYFGQNNYTYTFTDLRCCYALDAEFAARQCNITAVACLGGKIQSPDMTWSPPDHTQSFHCGDTPTYFIKPDLSNKISNVTVDGVNVMGTTNYHTYANGSAYYTFDPLVCEGQDIVIQACFELAPVDAFLKYQNATRDCRGVTEVQVYGADNISNVLDYLDQVYLSGNSSSFDINGTTTGTHFGTYSAGAYADGATSGIGDTLTINVLSLPTTNPETYNVTYYDGTTIRHASLTILLDGTPVWAPAPPFGVMDVLNVEAQIPAWKMVTQAYLDAHPDFEGLIGAVIYVDDGTYAETIEIDTPGVHLVNMTGASPVIDATGITPKGSGPTTSAVFLSAGCTGIDGFEIRNAGVGVGGPNASGVAVYPSSPKCANATILDNVHHCDTVWPCMYGRVNILNNDIHQNENNGIRLINCSVLISGNTIHDNTDDGIDGENLFTGLECVDPYAITHNPASSEMIFNNIFGNGPSGMGVWEVYDPNTQTYRFTSNATACGTLPGWTDSGIQIREMDLPGVVPNQVLYLQHNMLHDNEHAGIYLWKDSTNCSLNNTISIIANDISDNGIFGISTRAGEPGQVIVLYNDIVGNKYWGIKNWEYKFLVAKENYWGEPGGPHWGPEPITSPLIPPCYCHEPDQRSDALGNGDNVSHHVEYNPWLYIPSEDIFHDGSNPQWMMRALGSDSLELQKGWNTLSVPCTLYTGADTVSEISALGDFITNSNTVVVYSWNATTGLWVDVGAMNLPIVPGQGYYIKMKSPSLFPVLYSDNPSPGLPTFPVVQGWNLIGAPWGIDRVYNGDCECDGGGCECCNPPYFVGDEGRWAVASPDLGDPEAFMMVWEALESIKEGNGGTKGVAIVVSPSVPGQYAIWSESVTSGFWQITNNREMATGEGYWVYMVNPSTYAGFEITPFFYT